MKLCHKLDVANLLKNLREKSIAALPFMEPFVRENKKVRRDPLLEWKFAGKQFKPLLDPIRQKKSNCSRS